MLEDLEKILIFMEICAIVVLVTFVGGIGFGIYKLIMWLI
jgi:hypothetical protein